MKILLFLIILRTIAPAAALQLAPGLEYRQITCSVSGNPALKLHEITVTAESSAKMRIFYNPGAHPDQACLHQYGGTNLPELARTSELEKALAIVNGIVFRLNESGRGYVSNGMLLDQDKVLALPQYSGAGIQSFVLWDANGAAHALRLRLSPCPAAPSGSRDLCGVEVEASSPSLSEAETQLLNNSKNARELVAVFLAIFPDLHAGLQSNMEISNGGEWSLCRPGERNWKCQRAPRTLLCLRQDGSAALYTTGPALVHDLAVALGLNGGCGGGCLFLYNLDGGGSSQMGLREPGRDFKMVDGRSTTNSPPPGCPAGYRPVEHYLGLAL